MLPNAKQSIANIYVSLFRHIDKVQLLNASVSCFFVSKNAFNDVKLLQKTWLQ